MDRIMKRIGMFVIACAMSVATASCGGGGGASATGGGAGQQQATTVAQGGAGTETASGAGGALGYVYAAVGAARAAGAAQLALFSADYIPDGYAPAAGAAVSCGGVAGTSGEDGFFSLDGVPAGTHTVTITKSGHAPASLTVSIVDKEAVFVVAPGADADGAKVAAPGALYVVSSPSKALIYLDGRNTGFLSPRVFRNMSARNHRIYATLAGYSAPAEQTVLVTSGKTETVSITLAPAVATPPAAASLAYRIVDTGQAACFDNYNSVACPAAGAAFYGQDAQHNGNQPSYKASADKLTVYDNNTGLTWQKAADTNGDGKLDESDKVSWSDGKAFAATLNVKKFGGYSDWRMPSIKELYSLIDFRGGEPSGIAGGDTSGLTPFINRDYFDFVYGDTAAGVRIIDAQYWSSTQYVAPTFDGKTFGVNFADGRIKGYPAGFANVTKYVLYVRGNERYGINDFKNNGDGTVTDAATGLMWQRDDSGYGMNWEAALAWVRAKNAAKYLGYSDWRLPNAKELQSIVDYTRSPDTSASAAIDPAFNCTAIKNEGGAVDYPAFWTGTTHMSSNGAGFAGVYVAFGRAMGYMFGYWQDAHGAGAQRSDPKVGSEASFPLGRGPQGDAVRVNNFVRLVRN